MKVLIIGLGSIARKHIDSLRSIQDDLTIYAIRSSAGAPAVDGIINLESIEAAKATGVDFVIVSNPTSEHFRTIESVQTLGIPMFIEKPVFSAIGSEEQALVDALAQQQASTYVACNLRFLDSIVALKKLLINKRINEVNVYCGSYLPNWRPGVDFRESYSARKELGGGVHIDLIHELDYVYWLFGEPTESTKLFSSKSSLSITAFDYANYIWQYEGFNASIILNYYRTDSKRSIEVVCEEQTYYVDLLSNSIHSRNQLIFSSKQVIADTYETQMRYFIHNYITEQTNINALTLSYKILELCLKN